MKDILPKVSIMIPTYNQERFIAQAIESALMQDYNNIEVIIADDCSTDQTGQIAQRYIQNPRITYIRNNKNLGRVGNYHHTLYTHTTGDWIINLDGDDYYTDKSFISKAMRRILCQKNVVCYFGKKYISPKLKKFTQNLVEPDCYLFDGSFYFLHYFEIGGFAHMGALYKKEIATNDHKCYTFNGLQADFHGIIRYCLYGNIIISKETGYQWRIHDKNASNSLDFRYKYKQELSVQKAIIQDIRLQFTSKDIEHWLNQGKLYAQKIYINELLSECNTLKSLKLGLVHFRWERGYAILYIKSMLKTFFKIDLFR